MPVNQLDPATLSDALACKTLLDIYWYAEIIRDPDLFASIWTEDARFGPVRGRANIREAAVGFFKQMVGITELRISPAGWHVDVQGDKATGQFFILAQQKVPQKDGTIHVNHSDASYDAEFVRTTEGWRMSQLGGIKDPDLFHDTDITTRLMFQAISN